MSYTKIAKALLTDYTYNASIIGRLNFLPQEGMKNDF
jgi:hypothetical protein